MRLRLFSVVGMMVIGCLFYLGEASAEAVDYAETTSRLWGVAECRLNSDGSVTLVDARDSGDGYGLMMFDGISLGVDHCELKNGQTCQVTDGRHVFIEYTYIGVRDDKIGFKLVDRFTWNGEDVHHEDATVWMTPYAIEVESRPSVLPILGYCPTMEVFARQIADRMSGVELSAMPNTVEVLRSLASGLIHVGLVGREARPGEISSLFPKVRLKEGWTLVSSQAVVIDEHDLGRGRVEVHTYLDEAMVKEFLPLGTRLVVHASRDEAFASMDRVILADWRDLPDDYQLVIPVRDGVKVPRFRAPVLYGVDEEWLNDFVKGR